MSLPPSNLKRLGSFLIDILILNVFITKPLSSLIETNIPQNITDLFTMDLGNIFFVASLISLINFIYWIILEYKIKQTIGALIFNISVKSETKSLTFLQIFIRNITKLSFLLLIIDSIGILFTKKKQRFTEKLTKTLTIENG
ncbi:MAG: RDD family protein [Nanoarchaeota archaeon]|nr:RDD family protein [Nanoarchaeota archaeon]